MSANAPAEFHNELALQPLIPDVMKELCRPHSILGPDTSITAQDIAKHRIQPANELKVDQSILEDSWFSLLHKLSLTKNESTESKS